MSTVAPHRGIAPHAPAATRGRTWFAVTAVIAWAMFAFEAVISVGNLYPATGAKPGEIDYHQADGLLGVVGRTLDLLWMFTNWSVLAVAVVMTGLALGRRDGAALRAVWLSSLVMISVTALVYAVLLGPTATTTGLLTVSNQLRHVVLPALAVLVFLVAGPRGWFSWRTVLGSLVIPIVWVVYTLIRGTVVGAWPYSFLDASAHGWASVGAYVGAILALAVVIACAYWGIDLLIRRLARRRTSVS